MDSDVGRDGEEGYNLREMGSDGQGGWEEGGVDGSAGGGVSATAAAMERSIDRSNWKQFPSYFVVWDDTFKYIIHSTL